MQDTETERLLDSRTPSHYGAIDNDEVVEEEQDEEDVRLERQALEQISARAADDMIDILHGDAETAEHGATASSYKQEHGEDIDAEDAEQAWLQDLPANELDQDVAVKGSYAGNLVTDVSQLRDQGQSHARRAL